MVAFVGVGKMRETFATRNLLAIRSSFLLYPSRRKTRKKVGK